MKRLDKQNKNYIKSILFASGDPFEKDKLVKILGINPEDLCKYIEEINAEYKSEPFMIINLENTYQLCVKAKYSPKVKEALLIKHDLPLTQAAAEILAIIAYNQPVTKAFIEQIRGVDSSSTVNTLVKRRLIEEAGRLELPGRPIAYKTTENFLKCFGLESIKDLPIIPTKTEQETLEPESRKEV